jgi:hypothetical protein
MPLSSPAEPSLSHHTPPVNPGPGAVPGLRAVVSAPRARRSPAAPEEPARRSLPAQPSRTADVPRAAEPSRAAEVPRAAEEPRAAEPSPTMEPRSAEVPRAVEVPAEGPPPLPDPRPLVTNLARCVVEILAGAREIEQIARWVNDEVYRHLLKRVVLATRARSTRSTPAERPRFSVGAVRVTEPSDGVVEAVVIMHGRARSRAVAVRLESMGTRWRATAIHVL